MDEDIELVEWALNQAKSQGPVEVARKAFRRLKKKLREIPQDSLDNLLTME